MQTQLQVCAARQEDNRIGRKQPPPPPPGPGRLEQAGIAAVAGAACQAWQVQAYMRQGRNDRGRSVMRARAWPYFRVMSQWETERQEKRRRRQVGEEGEGGRSPVQSGPGHCLPPEEGGRRQVCHACFPRYSMVAVLGSFLHCSCMLGRWAKGKARQVVCACGKACHACLPDGYVTCYVTRGVYTLPLSKDDMSPCLPCLEAGVLCVQGVETTGEAPSPPFPPCLHV